MTGRLRNLRARFSRGVPYAAPPGLAAIGPNSIVLEPTTILCPHRVEIGDRVLVFENAHFSLFEEHGGRRYEPQLRIGDGVVICPRTWISCVGEVEIEEEALIGAGVLLADAFHEFAEPGVPILKQPMRDPAPVRIGRGAFIGPGASVMSGVSVGEGAYVMPGSAVVCDVAPRSVVAGYPAEAIRTWDEGAGRYVDTSDPRWTPLLSSLDRGAA